eukprot:jgi/Chlat1/3074/Chrsp21S03322
MATEATDANLQAPLLEKEDVAAGTEEALLLPTTRKIASQRLASLDALRGLVVVIMAWDHCTHILTNNSGADTGPDGAPAHHSQGWQGPLEMFNGSFPYFFSRFVSHICATAFSMLMGVGIVLLKRSRERAGWSDRRILQFLIVRGMLLIVMGLVANSFFFTAMVLRLPLGWMDPTQPLWRIYLGFLQILVSLGVQMIATALLVAVTDMLPSLRVRGEKMSATTVVSALCAVAASIVTQVVAVQAQGPDPVHACDVTPHSIYCDDSVTTPTIIERIFMLPGTFGPIPTSWEYPVMAWLPACLVGVSVSGWFAGASTTSEAARRAHARCLALGVVFLAAFAAVRLAGGRAFSLRGWPLGEGRDVNPLVAFLNVCKYPPSIAYMMLTLGQSFVSLYILWAIGVGERVVFKPLLEFGRAPLLFYLTHFHVIIVLSYASYRILGHTYVGALPWVLPVWGLVLLPIEYVLCSRYAQFKATTPPESLWRFL